MVFGKLFGRRKAQPAEDPLAAYDRLIEDLERQSEQLRRSAATLLSVRNELVRTEERMGAQKAELRRRLEEATARGDERAAAVLRRDLLACEQRERATVEASARAQVNAQALLDAASEASSQLTELKTERSAAQATLVASRELSAGLRDRIDRLDRVLRLESARDEVERAHALAEVYRQERGG